MLIKSGSTTAQAFRIAIFAGCFSAVAVVGTHAQTVARSATVDAPDVSIADSNEGC